MQATVPAFINCIALWALAWISNILFGQILSQGQIWSGKVQHSSWIKTAFPNPCRKVHLTNNFLSLSFVGVSCIDVCLEVLLEVSVVSRGQSVILDPGLDHCLEMGLIENEILHVVKKLIALLIGNLGERVVGFVILNDWVKRGVG